MRLVTLFSLLSWVLRCFALRCIALLCVALHCFTLLWFALVCVAFHGFAFICIALRCVRCFSLYCIALQVLALRSYTLFYVTVPLCLRWCSLSIFHLTTFFTCDLLTSKNKLIDVVTRTIGRPIVLHMISLPVDPPANVTLHVHCVS